MKCLICCDIFHLFRQDKNTVVLKDENQQQMVAFFGDLTATADQIGEAGIQVFLKL